MLRLQRVAGNRATVRLLSTSPGLQPVAEPFEPSEATLSTGMFGAAVVALQHTLNLLGFGPLEEDGSFGPLTRGAVAGFQSARDLEPDGVVGPQTRQALVAATASRPAATPVSSGPGAVVGQAGNGGLNDTCAYLPGEKDRTASDPGGGSVASLIPGAEPNRFAIFGFTQGASDLKPAHVTFLRQMVAQFELAGATPKHRIRLVEGFSDCVDTFALNVSIRRARALATKITLLDLDVDSANIGDAVASQAVLDSAQFSAVGTTAEEGRRQNRAAVCHLEVIGTPREEPLPQIPEQDTSCDRIHDKFLVDPAATLTAQIPLFGKPFGVGLVGFGVVNCKTRCVHLARFIGGGFSVGLVALEFDKTAPSVAVTSKEPVHSEELSGPAKLTITRVGPIGLNVVRANVEITAGPIAGTVIDLGDVKVVGRLAKKVFGRVELAGRFTVEGPVPSEIGGAKVEFPQSATDCSHDPTQ